MLARWSDRLWSVLSTHVRRGVLFAMAVVITVTVAAATLTVRPASAAGINIPTLGGSSCAIETVGWVLCPTMRSIARLADKGFAYINKSSLSIKYDLFGSNSTTFRAWETMRNIANGAFVIIFIIMIYNYLLGRTGGTYSLKRLLPRLIIVAIIVNTSYYIGVILVDVSNILGDAVWDVLKNIYSGGYHVLPLGGSANPTEEGVLTKTAGAVMGDTAMAWALMPLVAAVTITVATVSAATVILVIMRETLITALVLAAPLLIVLYLLPNIERFSSQAMRLFLQLLILYPIIALLLGTGQIVSTSLAAGTWGENVYTVGLSGNVVPRLVAAAAAVVPLIGIWFIFKNMSSIMSAAGTRLSASLAGRRGGKSEDKAKVTGNAPAGATKGVGVGPFNRRQAFSRKRLSSLGGSSLADTNNRQGIPGAGRQPGVVQPQVSNQSTNPLEDSIKGKSEDTKKQLEELNDARLNGSAEGLDIENAMADAIAEGSAKEQENKKLTAKDLFNNLNRAHESKDKDRKFNAGPAPAGSGGGTANGPAGPTAPSTSYRAPSMAQSGNIVTGSAAPQPTKIVAVPVQVDASSLLGKNSHENPSGMTQPPVSGTEEKAKARAQKYLYDSQAGEGVDDKSIFGNKTAPTEQPHTKPAEDSKPNDDKHQQ